MNKKELRERIENLNPLPDNAPHRSWLSHRISLRDNILNKNPEKFITWPVIKATMFIGDFEPIRLQLEWLLENDKQGFWKQAIEENGFGDPEMFDKTSGNLINQAYYLRRWEGYSRYVNQLNTIVEFGGGYGAMALICNRMGFHGQYTIIDLPEFLLLQEYYLSNVLDDISNIQFISTFDDYELDTDLIISICALSEIDETMKNRFFEQVEFKHHLITFQPDWEDWNNEKYFSDRFNEEPITNIYFTNHQYLIG